MGSLRVCLFGHRDIEGASGVEEDLFKCLCSLIEAWGDIEIYLGNNGDFDRLSLFATERLIRRYGSECCSATLVLYYERKKRYELRRRI